MKIRSGFGLMSIEDSDDEDVGVPGPWGKMATSGAELIGATYHIESL